MKSSLHITNNGNTIRAKGAAAQALFDALTKPKEEVKPACHECELIGREACSEHGIVAEVRKLDNR